MAPTDRNRELAVQHALLIQKQKDMARTILSSIELLMEYPPARSSDPLRPKLEDVNQVERLLKPFQPSDFDDLVQERNINGFCGYVFCPREYKKEKVESKYRILYPTAGSSLSVVETKNLPKWCSDDCHLSSYWIRLQLDDTPAWERSATKNFKLELYDPGKHELHDPSTHEKGPSPSSGNVSSTVDDLQKLAIERGERGKDELRATAFNVKIHERKISDSQGSKSAKIPEITVDDGDSQDIEGHVPCEQSRMKLPIRSKPSKSNPA